MGRRMTALLLTVAVAGLLASPVDAVAKKKARPVALTYYLNWGGECGGTGYLALKHVPNADSCALFFPELGSSYYFGGGEGLPFTFDGSQDVTVDFTLNTVTSVAADFEASLTATVGDSQVDVASASVNVQASGPGDVPVHFDLAPASGLDQKKVSAFTLTITWTGGVTYSSMDLDAGTATLVAHGSK